MDLNKPLHEWLREWAKKGVYVDQPGPIALALEHFDLTPRLDNVYVESCFLKKIAEGIERDYIPRPRFESGDIVMRGDKAKGSEDVWDDGEAEIESYVVDPDGGWVMFASYLGEIQQGSVDDRVQRPDSQDLVTQKRVEELRDAVCDYMRDLEGGPETIERFEDRFTKIIEKG